MPPKKHIGIAHSGGNVILKSRAGSVRLTPVETPVRQTANRVYVKDGEVKVDIVTDTMTIQEAKELTLKAVDLEYSLP